MTDHPADTHERRERYRAGLVAERWASLVLQVRGYRILDRRWSCRAGEIDIVAVRGRRLVFVEVKRRAGVDDEEAHAALGPKQRARVRRAAELWLARNAHYRDHDIAFDLVLVAPWRLPRVIQDGL